MAHFSFTDFRILIGFANTIYEKLTGKLIIRIQSHCTKRIGKTWAYILKILINLEFINFSLEYTLGVQLCMHI